MLICERRGNYFTVSKHEAIDLRLQDGLRGKTRREGGVNNKKNTATSKHNGRTNYTRFLQRNN